MSVLTAVGTVARMLQWCVLLAFELGGWAVWHGARIAAAPLLVLQLDRHARNAARDVPRKQR